MDPFLEKNPDFQELHTQFLAQAQAMLQPQLRPKYVARLERHLSEGAVWGLEVGVESLEGKDPDIVIAVGGPGRKPKGAAAVLARPSASKTEELDLEELELRRQRRIVIYVKSTPRVAVASIELLNPSNKQTGSVGQARYLEKRASALHGGLHWIEIDLLRAGQRPPVPVSAPSASLYLAYVAQATPTGWKHLVYGWGLRDSFPVLPIPLLGDDQVGLDLAACFREAYDRIAADDEAEYDAQPPLPAFDAGDAERIDTLLRGRDLRK
jgi:hypothetical protein